MNLFDYILVAVVAVCVYLAVRYIIKRKKSGKCVGCGECDKCGGSGICPKDKKVK
jgi:ferredoxin